MRERVTTWTRVADVCYWIFATRARDLTESTARRSALVVAPHPDDETFGCAATILRKRAASTRVTICVVSDGGAFPAGDMSRDDIVTLRDRNMHEACRRLGVPDDDLLLLGYPDSELSTLVDPVTNALSMIIAELDPDEIYIPSSIDWHPDHVAVHDASLRAVAQSKSSASLYTYPVWFWSSGAWMAPDMSLVRRKLSLSGIIVAAAGRLRPRKVRTNSYREAKRDVMEVFRWELESDYDFFEKWHLRSEELFFLTSVNSRART